MLGLLPSPDLYPPTPADMTGQWVKELLQQISSLETERDDLSSKVRVANTLEPLGPYMAMHMTGQPCTRAHTCIENLLPCASIYAQGA